MLDVLDKELELSEVSARYQAARAWNEAHPEPPWDCASCGRLIEYRGMSADSLHLHHELEDPWNPEAWLEPYHVLCHREWHAILGQRRNMSSYLGQHFDASLDVSGVGSREELERRQIDRLSRSLAVVLMCGSIPRRLGGDATPEELALDKKRARRTAHALKQALGGWIKRYDLPLDDKIRQEGAQLDWETWRPASLATLQDQLRCCATWALTNKEEGWGKSAVVRLENERNWLNYASRD